MTHYYTACLEQDVEAVKITLQGDGHTIVNVDGPFDDVWLQRNEGFPKVCCTQPGDGNKMVIHSRSD
jgi:hypothetical protein